MQWHGSHQSYLLHFKEQVRQYNEISEQPYTDDQLIRFMENAINGVPHLSQVLQLNQNARAAAGNTTSILWDEYLLLLINQAQVYDQSNNKKANPTVECQVNEHSIIFNDIPEDEEYCPVEDFEMNVHDIDTPIDEFLAYQTAMVPARPRTGFGMAPRKVTMNSETW